MDINGKLFRKVTRVLIFFLIINGLFINKLMAQVGGNTSFDFLNLVSSARVASMGGDFLSINDGDIALAINNPSLINSTMNHHLSLSIVDYYSDINYGFAAYSHSFEKYGSFVGAIQFVNYGKFDYADNTGIINGRFGASELAMQIGWAKAINSKWQVGSNLKYVYSSFEGYNSQGIAIDLSGSFFNAENGFSTSLIVKNIGWQVKSFTSENKEGFPFEIQFGLSKRLKHIPFRYSLLINHINKWNVSHNNPYDTNNNYTISNGSENSNDGSLKFGDQLFRHIVIGGELLLSENFILRLGYNYKRRKELGIDSRMSTVGFSWGFEFKISRFRLAYARSAYHLVGSPNYFTITTNIAELFKH